MRRSDKNFFFLAIMGNEKAFTNIKPLYATLVGITLRLGLFPEILFFSC